MQRMHAFNSAFRSVHMQPTMLEINLRPSQLTQLGVRSPCRYASKIAQASLAPLRPRLRAASINRSTSASVKYSLGLYAALGNRRVFVLQCLTSPCSSLNFLCAYALSRSASVRNCGTFANFASGAHKARAIQISALNLSLLFECALNVLFREGSDGGQGKISDDIKRAAVGLRKFVRKF